MHLHRWLQTEFYLITESGFFHFTKRMQRVRISAHKPLFSISALNSFVFILWENSYCFDYKVNLEMDIFIFSKVVYICLDF